MKSAGTALLSVLFGSVLVFWSCTSPPHSSTPPSVAPGASKAQTAPVAEKTEKPAPQPVQPAQPSEQKTPRAPTEKAPSGPEKPAPQKQGQRQPIEVSKEVYNKTFNEVEKVIGELNSIIAEGDFQQWKSYLTSEYQTVMSEPSTLEKVSNSPILLRNKIVLRSLEDYFRYVVVPSRSNARLDDLVFLDKNTVEAIMVIRGQRVILYQLENRDGKWKIGLF